MEDREEVTNLRKHEGEKKQRGKDDTNNMTYNTEAHSMMVGVGNKDQYEAAREEKNDQIKDRDQTKSVRDNTDPH